MKRVSARSATERISGNALALTNLDKVLWPDKGYTKGDLIAYYRGVARWLLPYLKDRPLTLERYPAGVAKPGFFEKQAPKGLPAWVRTIALRSGGARPIVRYIVCDDEATLSYVANLAAIALHVWMSRAGSLDKPDFILLDLDRGDGCTLGTLATVALAVREELQRVRMRAHVKTTGGSGLHVVAWLRGSYDYERARDLAHDIALRVEQRLPKLVTLERMIAKRPQGRVYMDWVQVGKGKTIVMPFVVRARRGAPVSMPLRWAQVEQLRRSSTQDTAGYFTRWNIKSVPNLLRRSGDPWKRRT